MQHEPLAIVAGVRTPFAKSFGVLKDVHAADLGTHAVQHALDACGLAASDVNETVIGNVCSPADTSNIARVIALKAGVPQDRIAHTVNRNCASGMESVITGWQILREGRADVVVAGGTESMSQVPLLYGKDMTEMFGRLSKAKSAWQRMKIWAGFRPKHLKPIVALQLGLHDPVCGLNMGQTAEVLAKDFGITREDQDQFAMGSHHKAAAAQERCFLSGEIAAIKNDAGDVVIEKDNGIRHEQTMEQLAKLKPIFQKGDGTVTAGNSSQVTDGAAATVLMSAAEAERRCLEPLGFVTGYAIAGCDPKRMGLGPVFATHKLLKDCGRSLSDFELFEINEAFAAQVLGCLRAMESAEFAKEHLGQDTALGGIDPERLNIHGGAIALGHPVGTSGTRLIITLLRALKDKGLNRGLASLCVGGGQGFAVSVQTTL